MALETADEVLIADDLTKYCQCLAPQSPRSAYRLAELAFSTSVITVLAISALGFALPLPLV